MRIFVALYATAGLFAAPRLFVPMITTKVGEDGVFSSPDALSNHVSWIES